MKITKLPRDLLQTRDMSSSSLEGRRAYLLDRAASISPQGRQQLENWANFRGSVGEKLASRKDLEGFVYYLKVLKGNCVYFLGYCEEFAEWPKETPTEILWKISLLSLFSL